MCIRDRFNSPVNEGKIGEIIRVVANFCTVVGGECHEQHTKIPGGGWWARGGGAFKGNFFTFVLNNSKTTASSEKVSMYKIKLHEISYKKGPIHFFSRMNSLRDAGDGKTIDVYKRQL